MEVVTASEVAADIEAAEEFAQTARGAASRYRDIIKRRAVVEKEALALRADTSNLNPFSLEAIEQRLDGLWHELYALVACALGWRHREGEVAGWYQRAVDMGCSHPRIGPDLLLDLMYERKVPNAPFRHRIDTMIDEQEEADTAHDTRYTDGTLCEVARTLGCTPTDANRVIGRKPYHSQAGRYTMRLFIPYETAVPIARVLGMSPHAAGI